MDCAMVRRKNFRREDGPPRLLVLRFLPDRCGSSIDVPSLVRLQEDSPSELVSLREEEGRLRSLAQRPPLVSRRELADPRLAYGRFRLCSLLDFRTGPLGELRGTLELSLQALRICHFCVKPIAFLRGRVLRSGRARLPLAVFSPLFQLASRMCRNSRSYSTESPAASNRFVCESVGYLKWNAFFRIDGSAESSRCVAGEGAEPRLTRGDGAETGASIVVGATVGLAVSTGGALVGADFSPPYTAFTGGGQRCVGG